MVEHEQKSAMKREQTSLRMLATSVAASAIAARALGYRLIGEMIEAQGLSPEVRCQALWLERQAGRGSSRRHLHIGRKRGKVLCRSGSLGNATLPRFRLDLFLDRRLDSGA